MGEGERYCERGRQRILCGWEGESASGRGWEIRCGCEGERGEETSEGKAVSGRQKE